MDPLHQRIPFTKAPSTLERSPLNVPSSNTPLSNTISWHELKDWQRDNEYILTGYRRAQLHWKGCFTSVWAYLHNETINIHSHLWGSALFIYFLTTFYPAYVQHHEEATWKDIAIIVIFLLSAVFCLTASAFYHAASCHSKEVSSRCHALDYSGIVVLIVGSFYPSIYYGFFCDLRLKAFYLTSITFVGVCAAYIVLNPEYAKPSHRGARTAVFIGLGLCAVIPVTHLSLTHGFNELISSMGFGWLLASGALYIGGALLYANRIPEKLAPGSFDYFLASHQIFHVCVVLAAWAHYRGLLTCLHYRMSHASCL
ncbi:uncharacterized protein LACBIDRAFT_184966 [Laccaria bicolor S238N-H82]|uniref:Predicted protein n=1 Tax=Laccaria bicolor (strain S238N-H82 / ATCC MYA-4686) TaxID=486041 RepID=B0DBN7_LACBS|nr:uncharacterized protein LACBIDRAFT_184966 [Laccaria bicolor S238N-H82]EDR08031.1 predicted protein [Laccaria bicolor S238N-H82]|eukprot:XP_001881101.1 predicted protein [Laccaria bicolor S238N-H82]